MVYKIPLFAGSAGDQTHIDNVADWLRKSEMESSVHIGSAHKEHGDVITAAAAYDNERVPIVGIAGRSDALSATLAYASPNPVIGSRPDWKSKDSLMMYFFSTCGMPSKVPVGAVLGSYETASYVKRVLSMAREGKAGAAAVGMAGDLESENAEIVQDALEGFGIRSYKYPVVSDKASTDAWILFAYRDCRSTIADICNQTSGPVILCPPSKDIRQLTERTFRSFDDGHNNDAALVPHADNAALYAATMIGLYDDNIRAVVQEHKHQKKG